MAMSASFAILWRRCTNNYLVVDWHEGWLATVNFEVRGVDNSTCSL